MLSGEHLNIEVAAKLQTRHAHDMTSTAEKQNGFSSISAAL
jgi:hypothetical protein